LGNHGVDTLHSQHQTNGLGGKPETTSELKGQNNAVVGFGCAQKDWHQLIERDAVAAEKETRLSASWKSADRNATHAKGVEG
jgi:hypothetical protein